MGFNFRKSLNIAPSIRLNITEKGVSSVSSGGKGACVNIREMELDQLLVCQVLDFRIVDLVLSRRSEKLREMNL